MTHHTADPRGLRGRDHAPRVDEAALLHYFHLDDVGRLQLDDADQARVIEHRLVRHDRDTDRVGFAPHARHAGDVLRRHRLLEKLKLEGHHHAREPDRGVGVVARVGVYAELKIRPDRLAHRLHAVTVGLDVATDLDLGRTKPPFLPPQRLSRRLLRRQYADPGVEQQPVFDRSAEPGVNGNVGRARREIHARHLDRRLGVEEALYRQLELRKHSMDVGRVHADQDRRELRAQHFEMIDRLLFRVAGRGIDVAQTHGTAGGGDAHDRALLYRLGKISVLVFADQRHGDAEDLNAFNFHKITKNSKTIISHRDHREHRVQNTQSHYCSFSVNSVPSVA